MSREALGEFEQLVLLAIVRLGEKAYAVPIAAEIERNTGRVVSQAAVYVVLRRLEKKGLVSSLLADPTPERGGRAKRYYALEQGALAQLRESRDALLNMWRGVEETP